jgi:hydroxyacylglutathione hydrolase
MKIQYETEGLVIFESALFRTTSTLIYTQEYLLLIDPNWLPIEIDFIADFTDKHGKNKKRFLLFTHSDYDHIIGYGKFKDFETIASQNFLINPDQADILNQINHFDDENYIKRNYKIEFPRIDKPIHGGHEGLIINTDTYQFYQAKGHNRDGLITFNNTRGILIVGDYLSNIEFPYIYESLSEYKKTLATLEEIINTQSVNLLITGHGDFTNSQDEMALRIKESKQYLTELENAILNNVEFDFRNLFKRYEFSGIMMRFHEGNVKVVSKEIL